MLKKIFITFLLSFSFLAVGACSSSDNSGGNGSDDCDADQGSLCE